MSPVHGVLFRSDAKAEGGRVGVGGWVCLFGAPAGCAWGCCAEAAKEVAPRVFAKAPDPNRVVCDSSDLDYVAVHGPFRDALQKRNTRAWLGCTRSATVCVYLRGGCVKEHGDLPEHACLGGRSSALLCTFVGAGTAVAPRAKGVGADAWTNLGLFLKFNSSLRVECDLGKVRWFCH